MNEHPNEEVMFTPEMSNRLIEKAKILRDEHARKLGRFVNIYRIGHTDMTREDLGRKARLHPQWIQMLEHELLGLDDLSGSRLRRIGAAIGIHPAMLYEVAQINPDQLLNRARPLGKGIKVNL